MLPDCRRATDGSLNLILAFDTCKEVASCSKQAVSGPKISTKYRVISALKQLGPSDCGTRLLISVNQSLNRKVLLESLPLLCILE